MPPRPRPTPPQRPFRCSRRCPRSSRACRRPDRRRAPRRCPDRPMHWRSRRLAAGCAREKRLLAVVSADALAAQRSPTSCRGSRPSCASRCCPTGKRCPTTTSRRIRTWSRSGWRRSTTSSRGECDVLVVAATTALYRLAPPDYLAAFTFFLKQGTRLDLDALRAQLALAGYQHVTQVVSPGEFSVRGGLDRPLPDGQRAAVPPRPVRRRHREHQDLRRRHAAHAVPGSRRAAAAGARVSRSTRPAARASAAASARRSRAIRQRSPLYKDVSNGMMPGGIEYYLPLFFDATATFADYLPRDAAVALHRRRRRRGRTLLAGHRGALPAAARRQGAAAAAADRPCSCRPTRSTAR